MALKLISKKPKRKAGTRAGLTKTLIAAEAAKLIELGLENFSFRNLAAALDVVPTSIHAHFNGGVRELLDEVVRTALGHIARPFKPKEEAADYLRDLFLAILQSLHGKPLVGMLAVERIKPNPALLPLLAERLLASFSALGPSEEAMPKLFARALGLIYEMIVTESARSNGSEQKASAKRVAGTIAALSPSEFPCLVAFSEALVAEVALGGTASPTPEVALYYANHLIAMVDAKC